MALPTHAVQAFHTHWVERIELRHIIETIASDLVTCPSGEDN